MRVEEVDQHHPVPPLLLQIRRELQTEHHVSEGSADNARVSNTFACVSNTFAWVSNTLACVSNTLAWVVRVEEVDQHHPVPPLLLQIRRELRTKRHVSSL